MNIRRLDDPTCGVVRAAPLNLVDYMAALGKAELVVAPIFVPVAAFGSGKSVADDVGIEKLDKAIVVSAKKTDANRRGAKLMAFV